MLICYYNNNTNIVLQKITAQFFAILRTIRYATTKYDISAFTNRLDSYGFDIYNYLTPSQIVAIQSLIPELYHVKGSINSLQQLLQYLYNLPQLQLREYDFSIQPIPALIDTTTHLPWFLSTQSSTTLQTTSSVIFTINDNSIIPTLFFEDAQDIIWDYAIDLAEFCISIPAITTLSTLPKVMSTTNITSDPLWQLPINSLTLNQSRTPYFQPTLTYVWSEIINAQTYLFYVVLDVLQMRFLQSVEPTPNITLPYLNINVSIDTAFIFLTLLLKKVIDYNDQNFNVMNTLNTSTTYFMLSPDVINQILTYDQVYNILQTMFGFEPLILSLIAEYIITNINSAITEQGLLNYLIFNTTNISETILHQYAKICANMFTPTITVEGTLAQIYEDVNYLKMPQVDYVKYWTAVATFNTAAITTQDVYIKLVEYASYAVPTSQPSSSMYFSILKMISPQLATFISAFVITPQTLNELTQFLMQCLEAIIAQYPTAQAINILSDISYQNIQKIIDYLKPIYARQLSPYMLEEYVIDSVYPSYLPTMDQLTNILEIIQCYSSTFISSYVYNNGVTISLTQPWINIFNTDQPNAALDQANVVTDTGSYLLYPREIASGDTEELTFINKALASTNAEVAIPYSLTNSFFPNIQIPYTETTTTRTYTATYQYIPTSYEISEVVLVPQLLAYTNYIGIYNWVISSFGSLGYNDYTVQPLPLNSLPLFQSTITSQTLVATKEWFKGLRSYYARYADDLAFIISFVNVNITLGSVLAQLYFMSDDNQITGTLISEVVFECNTDLCTGQTTVAEYISLIQQI